MLGKHREGGQGITRRQFLTVAAAAGGWLAVPAVRRLPGLPAESKAQMPVRPTGAPRLSRPQVVHVHSSAATSWDYASGWYGEAVSQEAVDEMVDRGVMELTGTASRAAAWRTLIPAYVAGQRVAIKVNLNNASSVGDSDNAIDALIEPVNSVVRGLADMGIAESDIWVYDASRSIPDRFRKGCRFPGVRFSGRDVNPQGFSTTERVVFAPPAGVPPVSDQLISQVLVGAHYLINMPIMKKHGRALVTLTFKNHFGSIEQCWKLHNQVLPDTSAYTPTYSPLVDIYRNRHFVGKTVLTIGDGLFGSSGDQGSRPSPWVTFGGRAPNSLFFSRDPVAIDCVMYDFLEAEAGVPPAGDDYLALAAQQGLGVFEHRAPGASRREDWYSLIEYVHLDLEPKPLHRLYAPLATG